MREGKVIKINQIITLIADINVTIPTFLGQSSAAGHKSNLPGVVGVHEAGAYLLGAGGVVVQLKLFPSILRGRHQRTAP